MASAPEPSSPEPKPKPESTAEPKTLFPEIMTNQEAFLMYGVLIFALTVFCIILLVLVILLKKKLVILDYLLIKQFPLTIYNTVLIINK